jgi:hypothetical protein
MKALQTQVVSRSLWTALQHFTHPDGCVFFGYIASTIRTPFLKTNYLFAIAFVDLMARITCC